MFVSTLRFLNPMVLPTFRFNTLNFNVAAHGSRGYASRSSCPEDYWARCSPEKMEGVTCDDPKSTPWYKPECCFDVCPDAMPRFDDLYYKPQIHRKYTRTWVDCPKMHYAVKKVCCLADIKPPKFEYRPARCHHGKECSMMKDKPPMMTCKTNKPRNCMKVRMPFCKQHRDPPRCFPIHPPTKCKKPCTPFPSFSECTKLPAPKRHPVECGCWNIKPFCHT